jgi:UDP-4-amino-4-deoxy-L-arabinose formyltransferase/UDP-glucuronic acid dehydrogenase (UDP-4-keto-hexauronic acid decarboxylating)
MNFAAFGRTRWMLDAIEQAAAAGHRPVLIGTAAPAPEYGVREGDFKVLADRFGAAFFADGLINSRERIELARSCSAAAAISVNWPVVIGPEMRSAFAHGIINAHAGDLPRYRGNACPNWAILAGEDRAFVTLHQMADGIDDGPIFLQRSMPISDQTYVGDIYRFMDESIPRMFAELLDALANGSAASRSQPDDPRLALRCFPRREIDSRIDWSQSSGAIARLVRASSEPFAGASSCLDGRPVRIWRARPGELAYRWHGIPGQVAELNRDGTVLVLCGSGVIVVEEIEIEGEGRGAAGKLLRSTRARFGFDAAAEVAALRERVAALEAMIGNRGRQ